MDEIAAYAALVEPLRAARDVGVAVLDRELRFVCVSEMIARFSGRTADSHVGASLASVLPDDVREVVVASAQRALGTEEAVFEVEIEATRGGEARAWTEHFIPLRRNGEVAGIVLIVVDRTAFRTMLHALRKSEGQFRAICETAPIGVFLTDATGSSLYTNHVNLAQMGITNEESSGGGWERAIHPDDRARVREAFYAATLAKRPYHGVNRYLHADGRIVYVDVKANGIYDGETLLGYVGVAEDITERRAAESALRESEMRFRQLADNIDMVFWLASADHREVLYVSPPFERIWGRPVSTVSDLEAFVGTIHPEDRAIIAETIKRPDEGFSIEYRIVRPAGDLRWIHDRGFPVRDENGVVVRQAGIATDVTEQRRLEAQALQSDKLDSIGRLAGGIAHDFNNLFGVIQGQVASVARALDAAATTPVDAPALRGQLREVEQAAAHAVELTRHLMTFARRQPVRPAVLDLNDVVSNIESLLRRLLGEHIRLELDLARDLAIVRADPTQVEQVMMNLVANARAAMPRGGTLGIATQNRAIDSKAGKSLGLASGPYVELAVSDTGEGISATVLPHIFEPFFTTRSASGGTGLGLPTCYGIARRSGGAIDVETRIGAGTTFRLYLPRIDESPQASAPSD